ncbi:TPA: hypothetical protein ACNV18_000863 [Pseudomonas putida]|uniref:hypothetical protein n=1 Tax=Pseudomonas TaxID=286 RepID=UPI000D9B97D7|nr:MULTISPECIES: hypothetical protein [Pseudomonas]EKV3204564.1 hypothetical protein [Pseudomonas aeruginosa]PYB98279.1 hypothetical protein DMX12_16870 [Pseudomonas sp. MB-090624]UZM92208.1 hypothetical protein OPZ46_20380 [Pseudomonas putida DOT-T1E]
MRKVFASALVQKIEYTLGEKNKAMIESWHEANNDFEFEGKVFKPFSEFYLSMLLLELPKEIYWLIEDSTKTKYCKERAYKYGLNEDEYKAVYDSFGIDLQFEFNYDNRNGVNRAIRLNDYLSNFIANILTSDTFIEKKVETIKIEVLTLNHAFYQAFIERTKKYDDFTKNPL